ncbi:hypothetical protein DM02DRAFT_173032 [Periconia macrospinosa]|uniref:Uncharacterized protein n=1 Tax=Periconia macrospinosa TaxID=97972 RepID=A0A2V1DBP1_9PLEO|nr:hypothetical protein DM02DRAFT_173032 [Periconia macrospinosa]
MTLYWTMKICTGPSVAPPHYLPRRLWFFVARVPSVHGLHVPNRLPFVAPTLLRACAYMYVFSITEVHLSAFIYQNGLICKSC